MYPSEFFKNLKLETIIAIRNTITTFSIHPVKLDKTECAWLMNIFAKFSLSYGLINIFFIPFRL